MKALRYPIRAVSKLTGIPVDTLRAWERRYAVVRPERDERGRIYSEGDVERLRLLRRAVAAGHAIGRVAPLEAEELRALLAGAPDAPEAPGPPPRAGGAAAAAPYVGDLMAAVERFDAAAFRRELSRLAALLPVRVLCRDVALPLLRRVGDAWHAGEIGVAQEHMVSAELRSVLGALARLQPIREGAPAAIFATPPGERHELATLAAAAVAAEAGLGPVYLGPDVPAADVVSAAARVRATVVVLGWTGTPGGADAARAALVAIARALPPEVELWVGGQGGREAARVTRGRAVALDGFAAYERALERVRGR